MSTVDFHRLASNAIKYELWTMNVYNSFSQHLRSSDPALADLLLELAQDEQHQLAS